jgi:hypothetical protein
MVSVLGHWDIGYHAPITEQYYWSFPCRDFGVIDWNMCPVSGIKNNEQQVTLSEWNHYDDYFQKHPDKIRVFLEPRTKHSNPDTIWLHEFEHPDNCVYVFGSAHYNPTLKHKRDQDFVVTVKTIKDNGVMWGDQALCITLYDRMMKHGGYSN